MRNAVRMSIETYDELDAALDDLKRAVTECAVLNGGTRLCDVREYVLQAAQGSYVADLARVMRVSEQLVSRVLDTPVAIETLTRLADSSELGDFIVRAAVKIGPVD